MRRAAVGLLALLAAVGCGTSRLERRVAELEATNRALEAKVGTDSAARTVRGGRSITPIAASQGFVMTVDDRPAWCNGPLCWRIENGHRNPVLLSINSQPVTVVGPSGPLLPPGAVGYVRLTAPTNVTVTYDVFDTIAMEGAASEMPLTTVLYSCRIRSSRIGTAMDARWGGRVTHLDHSFCW